MDKRARGTALSGRGSERSSIDLLTGMSTNRSLFRDSLLPISHWSIAIDSGWTKAAAFTDACSFAFFLRPSGAACLPPASNSTGLAERSLPDESCGKEMTRAGFSVEFGCPSPHDTPASLAPNFPSGHHPRCPVEREATSRRRPRLPKF